MVNGRTLVTGATGGLGRILAPMLRAQGDEVITTGRDLSRGKALSGEGFTFVPADLSHADLRPLLRGVSTVYHLAALASPWAPHTDFVSANVTATQRLLDASREAGCQRFIFASTPSIYTRAKDQLGITENTPIPQHLTGSYAQTKFAAEELVREAHADEFSVVSLRPRAIIGPFDTAILPRLLHAGRNGILPLPRGGQALIEPTDARDAARAFIAAADVAHNVSGRAFNISGGQPISVRTLATHAFARLERPCRVIAIPGSVALLAADVLEGVGRRRRDGAEPRLTRYSAMVMGWSQTFDLSAARSALSWEAQYTPFDAVDWALEGTSNA